MSNKPVTLEYDHQPAPGVQAHTKEVTQTGDNTYKHMENTTFEGPGGTHGVATERTEVTVEQSGNGLDATDGKKHHSHHHHHKEHHESESHSKGGLLHKIGKIFHSDKKTHEEGAEGGDAARLTKFEGQQQDSSLFNSPGHGYTTETAGITATPKLDTTIESESVAIVKTEIPTPKKGDRAAGQYAMEEDSSSSAALATAQAVKTTEQTTTKTTATVVGHVVEEREVHSNLSQRIQEAKRIEQSEEEHLVGGVERIRIGALQRESSAPYARDVDVKKQNVSIDVRQGTQTSDIAVGPYVVEKPGSHLITDASYKTTTTSFATGPTVVENQPQQSNLISERYRTTDVDQGYIAESQPRQSGILNEHMRTQDIARGDSTVENVPTRSGLISEKMATSDVASGPYVLVSPGQQSGLISEAYRTSEYATGPSVVENQPQQSGLINEQYLTRQIATGPSVVENQPQASGLISERVATRDVDQGYVLESQAQESGLVSEKYRTRDVDQGYVVESRGEASGLLSEQYKTRDRDTGPAVVENQPQQSGVASERYRTRDIDQGYVIESQAEQSNLLSERYVTSDIAAGPYLVVKEGEQLNVDATSREASAQLAGRDMYADNRSLQGVSRVTQKIENYEERPIERAPVQIMAAVGARVDQFEHEQMTEIVKTVPEVTVRRSVEDVKSELMTETPIQKTAVPDLHADVMRKAEYLERDESLIDTGVPEQISIAKHAGIGSVIEELRESSVTKVEKVSPPRLATHVPERLHELETQRETVVTSSPVDLVKHASIGGVIEELRESTVTHVGKTPAPIIESRVPQRAAEFAHHTQQETVGVSKKPVVLGRRVDIEQIKESLTTTKNEEVTKSAEIPQVQSNVRESVTRWGATTQAEQQDQRGYQREVSARGDVLGAVGKFSNRTEDVVTSKNVVDLTERGIVAEQKHKFESGAAFASENNSKTRLVVTSQPVEIAQVEVERTENIKSKNGSQIQSTDAAKSLVREDVTVKMNKNLEGMRVVPEKVIVQKEQHVTRTETVISPGNSGAAVTGSASSSTSATSSSTSAQRTSNVSEYVHESGSTTKNTISSSKTEQH